MLVGPVRGARHPPHAARAADGCTEVAAEHPGSTTIARPDRVRFKLGSTKTDASHAAGTYLLINQISGTIEDVTVAGRHAR